MGDPAGSRGRTTRILERGKFKSTVVIQTQSKQDVTALPKNVPSHMASIDKNNGPIYDLKLINKKPEILGQSVYN